MRRLRVQCKHVDDSVRLVLARQSGARRRGRNRLAEHTLWPEVVNLRVVREDAAAARRPAGERAREFVHILLRIAAVNSDGMQLHDLAGIVLVDVAAPA